MWKRKCSLSWNAQFWKYGDPFENICLQISSPLCTGVGGHTFFLGHIFGKSKIWSNYGQAYTWKTKCTPEPLKAGIKPSAFIFVKYLPFIPLGRAFISSYYPSFQRKTKKKIRSQFIKARTFIHHPVLNKEARTIKAKQPDLSQPLSLILSQTL